jgi:hypothetical protein
LIQNAGLQVNEKIVSQVMEAGYSRGAVLDGMYAVYMNGGDVNNVALVMKEIIKIEQQAKEKEKNMTPKTDDEYNTCKICFENAINAVIVPCGHVAICIDCSVGLKVVFSSLFFFFHSNFLSLGFHSSTHILFFFFF